MATIRDIKRKARRDLHERMKVPALYVLKAPATPKLLHVRIHSKWDGTTIDTNTNHGTMQSRKEVFPKILFMRSELDTQSITLIKGAILSVESGEAYRLDHSEPHDDLTVSWYVTQLDVEDTVGLPVPTNG